MCIPKLKLKSDIAAIDYCRDGRIERSCQKKSNMRHILIDKGQII